MKMLMCGLAMSLGFMATGVDAEQIINVDGEDYFLSHLTKNCQSITDDPAAQIACFGAISQLLDEQSGEVRKDEASIAAAFDALRAVAEYQDEETGLLITGSSCTINVVYFANYFHVSRRNISEIDLYSAEFDMSKLQIEQTVPVQGGQAPLFRGMMEVGTTAATRGGGPLDSSQHNFAPRNPRSTIVAYADEVVAQLPATEAQAFDFVLIHPQRSEASADIWRAFQAFAEQCKA